MANSNNKTDKSFLFLNSLWSREAVDVAFCRIPLQREAIYISANSSATHPLASSLSLSTSGFLLHSLLPVLIKSHKFLHQTLFSRGAQAKTPAQITVPAQGTWSCLHQIILPTFQGRIPQGCTPNAKATYPLTKPASKTLDLVWKEAEQVEFLSR